MQKELQYTLSYLGQGFCPLKTKIDRFPVGFRLSTIPFYSIFLVHDKTLENADQLRETPLQFFPVG